MQEMLGKIRIMNLAKILRKLRTIKKTKSLDKWKPSK